MGNQSNSNAMRFLMFLVWFLFLGLFFMISNQNLDLSEIENVGLLYDNSLSWISKLSDNMFVLTGHVVKLGWLPEIGEKNRSVNENIEKEIGEEDFEKNVKFDYFG
jgi:hypothetical protein